MMCGQSKYQNRCWFVILMVAAVFSIPKRVAAHCDTLDGPVVQDAQQALDRGEIEPVLKWVQPEHETELREAFAKARKVRTQGEEARDLADRYFFETLVRVHRAGEGAPYTGLKPAGQEIPPAVRLADEALQTGSEERLVELLTDQVARGLRERFARAYETRKSADESVEAGRDYVAAYVSFVHFAEGISEATERTEAHHAHESPDPSAPATEHAQDQPHRETPGGSEHPAHEDSSQHPPH